MEDRYRLAKYWEQRNGQLGNAIRAQEGRVGDGPAGTPRHPRTAAKDRRKHPPQHGPGLRVLPHPGPRLGAYEPPRGRRDRKFYNLLQAGYYEDYRRAFEAADE